MKKSATWVAALSILLNVSALASSALLPQQGTVVAGDVNITYPSAIETAIYQTTNRAAINWHSFDVAEGATVRFSQPSRDSVTLNRVLGSNSSQIFGRIEANGQVFLSNPQGIYFSENATADVGGLVATTHSISNQDFMAGKDTFSREGSVGKVENKGKLTAALEGYIALLATEVRNEGIIIAKMGTVGLASGEMVTLEFDRNQQLTGLRVTASQITGLVKNGGAVITPGGQIILSARSVAELRAGVVHNDARLEAECLEIKSGRIMLAGDEIRNTGTVTVAGNLESVGGIIEINGNFVALGGELNADGKEGGQIIVKSAGELSLAEQVHARGKRGKGGRIEYSARGRLIENEGSLSDVSGVSEGGRIWGEAAHWFSSGQYYADSIEGKGGRIELSARYGVNFFNTQLIAKGKIGGGLIRVGGNFQGGTVEETVDNWCYLGRWGELPALINAQKTFINDGTVFDVSSSHGEGGTAIIWAEKSTAFLGKLFGEGLSAGGVAEISAREELKHAGLFNVHLGRGGNLLLDPKYITVGNLSGSATWTYLALLELKTPFEANDQFGVSVSLNAAGDRLAVGVNQDDGPLNATADSGAVYLFSFSDTSFSNATLEGILGKGYSGGKNLDVAALAASDNFGSSVSLNATGDRLAVGASGDDGSGNAASNSGSVYLFTFTDTSFSGAALAGTIGYGYGGAKDINLNIANGLAATDGFGSAVSLNSTGNRLAVGASADDGFANPGGFADSGAVYLFTFSDTSFSGGALAGRLGKSYTTGNNFDVSGLEASDNFGSSVSLNATGDRLAVGASGDDGSANAASNSGSVYLFTFTDTSFSGAALAGTIGYGYGGAKDINLNIANGLAATDGFGSAVSLNSTGNRLAVGASADDGFANPGGFADSGAVYLFTFSDTSFSGGALAGRLGKSYTTGNNFDVSGLEASDNFGRSVSLNAAGDRLAVGASGDDGNQNTAWGSGAVYLFTFTDTSFSGASRVNTMGRYSGGAYDVNTLENSDFFGITLSLNANGDRLAVGASSDDGPTNGSSGFGAVYLFSFTDTSFSGAALEAIIGSGYSGGKNYNVTALAASDNFGRGVTLNGTGNRLAIGANNDDGSTNLKTDSGCVYLFSFTDGSFSGANLEGIIGDSYAGGKNVSLTLDNGDNFGLGVSLNANGDRLAVTAIGDRGLANASNVGSGAVYLFTFTDTTFSGGALAATLGGGYNGTNDYQFGLAGNPTLDVSDNFGTAVALNAAGNRLAVGAMNGDGVGNVASSSGEVYLFSFTNTNFSGVTLEAILGRGYSGGKNFDVNTLELNDSFGRGVALNAAGNKLAVGAHQDGGFGNVAANAGCVYLFNFTDTPTTFSGVTLDAIIGKGYTGSNNVDVSRLGAGDSFGAMMAFNATGDRLAIGAFRNDGSIKIGNYDDAGVSNSVTDSGGVYLFTTGTASPLTDAATYASQSTASLTVNASDINTQLSAGTAVTLQANSDITVNTAILANNAGGNGGALTLQAGRSILLNANITTDDGNLVLTANDTLAAGVINGQRDAGAAVITMAGGVSINAGAGSVDITLKDGAGKTNLTSGDITLRAITANTINIQNQGATAGSDVILSGALTANTGVVYVSANTGDINVSQNITTNHTGNSAIILNAGKSTAAGTSTGGNVLITGTPTITTGVGGRVTFFTGSVSGSTGVTSFIGSGSGRFRYNSNESTTNYSIALGTGNHGIYREACSVNVTANAASKTYDGLTYSGGNGVSYGAFQNGDTSGTIGGILSYGGTSQGAINVGSYTIVPSRTNGLGYTMNAVNGTLTVGTATLTVTANADSKTYNGVAYTGGNGVIYAGFVNGETSAVLGGTLAYVGSSQGAVNGGTYNITPSGLTSNNYAFTYVNGTLTVNKAALTVTANADSRTYTGVDYASNNGVSYSGFVNGETSAVLGGTLTYGGNSQTAKNVGSYTITPAGVTSNNYTITFADGTLTITPAALTITANAASKTYDGLAYIGGNGVAYSGFVNSETSAVLGGTLAYGGSSQGAINATNYNITPSGLTSSNYTITFANGTLTINPAALTITAANDSKTYDGLAYSGGNGVSYSGFVNSETAAVLGGALAYGGSSQGAINGGTYNITPSGLTSSNYAITFSNGTLTINKAPLTITAIDDTKTYTGVAYASNNGVSYSGFVNSETSAVLGGTLAYGGTSQAAINVGNSYTIIPSGLTSSNYTITFANGTLTITPAALTVTAANDSKTYDGLAYASNNGVSYSGFVGGETSAVLGGTLAYGGTSQGAINAGSYNITPSGLTSSNYTITFANGTLTINPAALTITAANDSKTYDGLAYSGGNGVSYSGFVNSETAAVLGGALAYGGSSQGAVNGGTYNITPAGLTSSNYTITFANGTLTINKAPLTVTANAASQNYTAVGYSGGNGVSYSGFVNSETSAVLGGTLAYGGTSQGAILPNTYTIIPSGLTSSNYTITFANGTLTITRAPLTITAANDSKIYDGLAYSGGNGVSYSGFVGGETSAVLGGTLVYGGDSQGAINVGSYTITPSGPTSSNYVIVFANGTLSINLAGGGGSGSSASTIDIDIPKPHSPKVSTLFRDLAILKEAPAFNKIENNGITLWQDFIARTMRSTQPEKKRQKIL